AHRRCAVRDWLDHDRVGADLCSIADRKPAQYFRSGSDDHAFAQRWMALFAAVQRSAAQRYSLVDRAVVADLGRLADHDTHAVVDEHAPADYRAGVNFD